MRKLILAVLCGLAVGVVGVAAAAAEEKDPLVFQVESLLSRRTIKNPEQVAELSLLLPLETRQNLYSKHQKSLRKAWLSFSLNMVAGLGVGSFIQGNLVVGFVQMAMEVVGGMVFLCTLLTGFNSREYAPVNLVAGAVFAGSFVVGGVSPFVYRNKYNNTLKKALSLDSPQVAVLPIIDLEEKSYGLYAAVRF